RTLQRPITMVALCTCVIHHPSATLPLHVALSISGCCLRGGPFAADQDRAVRLRPELGPDPGSGGVRGRAGAGCRAYRCLSGRGRSEEHTSELQSRGDLVCRLTLEKKTVRELSYYE